MLDNIFHISSLDFTEEGNKAFYTFQPHYFCDLHYSVFKGIVLFLFQELLDSFRLQLEEEHSEELATLRSSLTLSFKEEVRQVRHRLSISALNVSVSVKMMQVQKIVGLSDLLVFYDLVC